jgi:hypothetical protein
MPMAKVRSIVANAAPMRRRAGDTAVPRTASMALVPLAEASSPGVVSSLHLNRPDPSFVTHLIATVQQSPQTRTLRRAATADVQAAYQAACRSLANQNEIADNAAGVRMRLTA